MLNKIQTQKSMFSFKCRVHIYVCVWRYVCVCVHRERRRRNERERKGSKGKGVVRREQEGNSGKKGKSHVFSHMWSLFPPSVCVGMGRKDYLGRGKGTEKRE